MKKLVGFVMLVVATTFGASCGPGSSTDPPPPPEVARLNVDQVCYGDCIITLNATFSGGKSDVSDPYSLVVGIAEGAAPPSCDSTFKSGVVIQFQKLKANTVYGLRGCVFDGTKYTAGIAQTVTTGAP